MNAREEEAAGVFGALADPNRRRLLDLLAQRGAASATTLASGLPITRQAVLKQLTVLAEAGLVSTARHGREVLFQIRPEPLTTSARWLDARAAAWDVRLAILKRIAEAGEEPDQS